MTILGEWRIVEMDLWASEDLDLLGPAFINFDKDQRGSFRFLAVEGWMDCRKVQRDGCAGVEFTWDGNDECDPASGRGWARIDGKSLIGHIFFHFGDDSGFRATRVRDDLDA